MGLDGVELVMAWEETFQIRLTDEDAAAVRTPRMATELICRQLGAVPGSPVEVCLLQRSFYRLRRAFEVVLGCQRAAIRPDTRLDAIVPREDRRLRWQELAVRGGVIPPLKQFLGFALPTAHRTVAELARYQVARHPRNLLEPGAAWTHRQVRAVVRANISEQLGIPHFADDADFVRDLRVD